LLLFCSQSGRSKNIPEREELTSNPSSGGLELGGNLLSAGIMDGDNWRQKGHKKPRGYRAMRVYIVFRNYFRGIPIQFDVCIEVSNMQINSKE